MTIALRKDLFIPDSDGFRTWVKDCPPKDWRVYYVGDSLATDRMSAPDLDLMCDLITILVGTSAVTSTQRRARLPTFEGWQYTVTRREDGWIPANLIEGGVTPREYRALEVIRDRKNPKQSVRRSLRDAFGFGMHDEMAGQLMDALLRKRFIRRYRDGRYRVTPAGHRALI